MSFGRPPKLPDFPGRPGPSGGGAGAGDPGHAADGGPTGAADALMPDSFAAVSCALELAGRRIARQVARFLTPTLETKGLLAVVTASPTGAAVLSACRQLGNLQFPVSGIVLGSLEFAGGYLGDEIRRCRAFKVQLRECQNAQDLEFVLQFPGLRLVAVDLHEEVTRHSELRDGLLDRPCIDLWALKTPVTDPAQPWTAQVGVTASPPPESPAADWPLGNIQPLLTVADLPPPAAPVVAAVAGEPVHAPVDRYVADHWAPLTKYFAPAPVSRETARLLDSRAIKDFHLTGLRMMELAAFQAAEVAALMARPRIGSPDDRVAVICGRGNNGGDGFALARYLAAWGLAVEVYLLGQREKIFDDALLNLRRLDRLGELLRDTRDKPPAPASQLKRLPLGHVLTPGWTHSGPTFHYAPPPHGHPEIELVELTTPDHLAQNAEVLAHAVLIVDAVLGTGMTGEVRGLNRDAVDWINAARTARQTAGERPDPVPVLALDTPSGIDASTGAVLGAAVQADVTVTFGAPKLGFSPAAPHPDGRTYAGQVYLVEIGWPPVKNRGW